MPKLKAKLGFTLIELLVVISIIAILMGVATVSYTNAQEKGRDNRRKSDLKAVQQALEIYFNQNGKYPFSASDGAGNNGRVACITGSGNGITWGSAFTCSPTTYMNPLPKDPSFSTVIGQEYFYESASPNSTYILSARIENLKDPEAKNVPGNGLPCTPQGYVNSTNYTRNFCVINP